jgi:hypothetical protein
VKEPNAERQRIAAILTCEEARGREQLANVLALKTDHTVEEAKELLAAAAVTPPPKKDNPLEVAMAQVNNPKVGVSGGEGGEGDTPAAEATRILAFVPKQFRRVSA